MVDAVNVLISLTGPLVLTLFLLKGDARRFNVFLILGMIVCVMAGYFNLFLFPMTPYSSADATIYVSPISEEILKALPLLFYVLVFKPKKSDIILSALAIGIGFATLENCYYFIAYGSSNLIFALIRGFASGIMHAVCTAIIGYGLCFAYDKKKLDYLMTFGLLSTVITYHSIYNMLVSETNFMRVLGCSLPIATTMIAIIIINQQLIKQHFSLNKILNIIKRKTSWRFHSR